MRKIALLTIHHTTNFGSTLQTYALASAVSALGGDIELLDYRCQAIEEREFLHMTWKSPKSVYQYLMYGKASLKKQKALSQFLFEHMTVSQTYTSDTVHQANDQYDTFLVGSDIVWGLNITGRDFNYFLDFVLEGKSRVAFGSSAGLPWSQEDGKIIGCLLERFDHIAVRESMVAEWIHELTGSCPAVVSDPTMLRDAAHWRWMAKPSGLSKPYILVYFWDKEEKILQDALRLGRLKHMRVFSIRYGSPRKGVHSLRPTTVEEFLGLIQGAAYVFSGSYHGLLFALYFHTEVFYYNRANFARMQSLSTWLGLDDHNGMEVPVEQAPPLNFTEIDAKIAEQRQKSLEILRDFLDLPQDRRQNREH